MVEPDECRSKGERQAAVSFAQREGTKMKSIVVATDLSASADLAFAQAIELAKAWQAELWLLHVFNDSLWQAVKNIYASSAHGRQELTLTIRERLSSLVRVAKQRHGIVAQAETRTGEPAEEIARFAVEKKADLLVVGEHGENWVAETVLGGTALRVATAAKIPVLLIRRETAVFSNVLVAVDLSANSLRLIRLALAWFPAAKHRILHAYAVAFENRMRLAGATTVDIERYRQEEYARAEAAMRDLLAQLDEAQRANVRWHLRHGQASAVILAEARLSATDLIIIGRHGGSIAEERLLGSVTQNVLYHAPSNVLIVP